MSEQNGQTLSKIAANTRKHNQRISSLSTYWDSIYTGLLLPHARDKGGTCLTISKQKLSHHTKEHFVDFMDLQALCKKYDVEVKKVRVMIDRDEYDEGYTFTWS